MVRVSWLLAVLFALMLSAPAFAQPTKLTDGPPKTVAQQRAELEAQERLEEEQAWKAFEEAEAKYKEVRAANADKIEAYDDAIEAWRKANPAPAGTKESLISQSVDYETALYESTTITYFNKYSIPTHSITFGPDAKPTGPVTQTQQGKAWETIGPQLVDGGVFGISYGRDFDGNEIITRIQIGDERGFRTAQMEFNFEGIAWRTEYWGEDGKRKGGQEDLSRRPPERTMGGPLELPKIWRVITQPCEECRAKTDRYNELAAKANELINLMTQQSKMHETAYPEAQKPIKLRFNYLKRQLDEITPELQAAQAEALECHKICRPPEKQQQDAVPTSPPASKLPAPDLTRPSLIPVAKLEPPASFCDEFARVAYMNEVYTPAAKASLANAQTASAHLGKLGGMFTDYMKNEGGSGWAAVRAEQTAYGPIAQTATDESNAINAMYQRILAIPIVPCPDSKPRVATGDPAPPPVAPATDGVGVIPARMVEQATGGKKPCPPKGPRKPITVGPNSKVGSGAQLTKKLGGMLVGGLLGAAGVGGGGGGGGGPQLYSCKIKDSEMTLFTHPSGIALKVGAKRGKGDTVNIFADIAKSPDQGTFQAALLETPDGGKVQAPSDAGPCDLWGDWQLTVSWTKTTYVDGQMVSQESGGWSEGGKFSLPGMLTKSGPQPMWASMGFSSASHGAKEAFMKFSVPQGGGPLTFVTYITQPKGDPVMAVPFVMTMTETAPGVFTFTEGEAPCPEPLGPTIVSNTAPPPPVRVPEQVHTPPPPLQGSSPSVSQTSPPPEGGPTTTQPAPSNSHQYMTAKDLWFELPHDMSSLRRAIDEADANPCEGYERAERVLAGLRGDIARVRAAGVTDSQRFELDDMSKRLDEIEAELKTKKAAAAARSCPSPAAPPGPPPTTPEAAKPGEPERTPSILDEIEEVLVPA